MRPARPARPRGDGSRRRPRRSSPAPGQSTRPTRVDARIATSSPGRRLGPEVGPHRAGAVEVRYVPHHVHDQIITHSSASPPRPGRRSHPTPPRGTYPHPQIIPQPHPQPLGVRLTSHSRPVQSSALSVMIESTKLSVKTETPPPPDRHTQTPTNQAHNDAVPETGIALDQGVEQGQAPNQAQSEGVDVATPPSPTVTKSMVGYQEVPTSIDAGSKWSTLVLHNLDADTTAMVPGDGEWTAIASFT